MAAKLYAEEAPRKQSEAKDVALWQERISIAEKSLKAWADESGADRFVKEYKGNYQIVLHSRNKQVKVPPINEVFSYVQSDIATTYNRDPYIAVNAEAGTVKGAALWEVLINYWWRKLKIKEEIEYEIIDKDVVGYAWHKVGNAVYTTGSGDALQVDQKLYSRWLDWKDVVWNIGSKRPPYDCEWMAHRIVKPIQDIKDKYPAAKGLEGSQDSSVDKETYSKASYKDDIKVGVMWEIWDSRKRQILLTAENLKDRYLEAPKPWPDYQTEFPLLMYWDFAIPGSPRPLSAIAPWEPQILEEMILVAQAINHAKRWNRQAFVNNASIDENALDKFERGDDGAIITVHGKVGNEDLRFADFGQLPPDFYLLMDRLQAIKRNINGQPEFVKGGVTKTNTRTIGELQLMQQGTQSRQSRKIDRLETHCENIARHMMACLKDNFDFEATLKITGELPEKIIEALGENYDPQTESIKFSPEDIAGEYDVDVKAGSTLPMDKQIRIQVMEIVLDKIAAAAAQGPLSPFLNALVQELLKDYDIKALEEAYQQEQQMADEAKQKAQGEQDVESQKTMAETQKRQAQAQQIGVDTEIKLQDAQLGPVNRAEIKKLEKHPPVPGESISYKDLPEEGRIQMAAQAGIRLDQAPLPKPPANGVSK